MSRNSNLEEWLYNNIPSIDHDNILDIEKGVNDKYKFSSDFKGKMNHLIVVERRNAITSKIKHFISRAVAVVIGITIGVFLLSMSAEANRIRLFDVIKRFYSNELIYNYKSDEKNSFTVIRPHRIPNGYTMIEQKESPYTYYAKYTNSENEALIWQQLYVNDTLIVGLDSEFDWENKIYVGKLCVNIHGYNSGHKLAYVEIDNYIITINADNLDVSDIVKMFE